MRNLVWVILSVGLALGACSTPEVQFTPANSGALDSNGNRQSSDAKTAIAKASAGAIYFSVATNRLSFKPAADWSDKQGVPSSNAPFTVGALPIDSDKGFYATPKSQLFQASYFSTTTTVLTIQNVDGTHVPSSITTTVSDNAQAIFQTISSAATGAGAFLAARGIQIMGLPAGPQLNAFFIDLPDAKSDVPTSPRPVPNNANWTYQISLDDPIAADAVKLADFTESLPANGGSANPFVDYFPIAACRQAKITLTSPNGNPYTLFTTVGTPEWVEVIPIPANGKITAGANCGASTTPGNVDPTTPLKDIAAALNAASSIKGTVASKTSPPSSPASNKSK